MRQKECESGPSLSPPFDAIAERIAFVEYLMKELRETAEAEAERELSSLGAHHC